MGKNGYSQIDIVLALEKSIRPIFVFIGIILLIQLCFSQLFRIGFILMSKPPFDWKLFSQAMLVGIPFDIGIAFVVLWILLFFYTVLMSFSYRNGAFYALFYMCTILQLVFSLGDILLFKYWDSIFSVRALSYLHHFDEVYKNTSLLNLIFVLGAFIAVSIIYRYVYHRVIAKHLHNLGQSVRWYVVVFILIVLLPISFLVLRGGLREIPKNQSDGFFCSNRTYNIATINSTWNFFNVIVEHEQYMERNPYHKMSSQSADQLIKDLYCGGDGEYVEMFHHFSRPNIVLITMEGVSAELLKIHNEQESVMPFLESWIDSSYYFTNAYAIGFRTEQGIAALLSGTLSTPYNNLTDNVNNLPEIPSIVHTLRENRYQSTFLFGGNVEFANMRAYLTEMGFDSILDISSFELEKRIQKLGVPDEYLFQKAANKFSQSKNPFFMHIMTQSTHEPYDIPHSNRLESEKSLYKKSAKYLDNQLQNFFRNIRESKQFQNTIFVICSDHAHRLPDDVDIADKKRYHIPFLIYSPLLKGGYRGYKDSLLFAQNNFPATWTYLMKWKKKNYVTYSLNHFSSSPKFVFTSFVNGYLFQRDSQVYSYDYIWRPFDSSKIELVRAHRYPMAIMQTIVDEIRGKKKIDKMNDKRL